MTRSYAWLHCEECGAEITVGEKVVEVDVPSQFDPENARDGVICAECKAKGEAEWEQEERERRPTVQIDWDRVWKDYEGWRDEWLEAHGGHPPKHDCKAAVKRLVDAQIEESSRD